MATLPSGTVTFLFTDIEGSTSLWQSQPETMKEYMARHDQILREAIESSGGSIVKATGDGYHAAFPTAPQALQAATSAQRALSSVDWPPGVPIRVRMGLHTGSGEERGGDYYGPAVNRAARLMSAAHGGQVLVSAVTYELIRDVLPSGVGLRDVGEHRLKDLTRPEHIWQLAIDGINPDFPPLRSLETRPNNLPFQPTPFFGRERDLKAVCRVLSESSTHLLTLTGPGGTGKTRLALQAAADGLEDYPDGVFFVDLAPITDPSLVASTIARELGVVEVPGQSILNILKKHLQDQAMLLLLDNFEQVSEAAPIVSEVIAASPKLKVLVTSRMPLRVRGEREYPVPALSLPDPNHLPNLDTLSQYDAVRLFIERARDVRPDFEVTNENAPAVAEICARLDGLPLAVELAAARVRIFPPHALLPRLTSRLKLLTGGARDASQRQKTLRAAIDWSYELLSEEDKTLFARLAVFVGGRTFEAIEAICNLDGELDVLGGVESVIEKSLLRQEEEPNGEPRFVMLETIQEYAWEKLRERGEADEVQRRHAEYFLTLAEEAEDESEPSRQVEWLNRLETEHDNLRAALRWALDGGDSEVGLRIAGTLGYFWLSHSHLTEGRRWLEQALSQRDRMPPEALAKALMAAGEVVRHQGDYDHAVRLHEESLALWRQVGDRVWIANDLAALALSADLAGQRERSIPLLEESLALWRDMGYEMNAAVIVNNLGITHVFHGDYDLGRLQLERALAEFRRLGNPTMIAQAHINLGTLGMAQGEYAVAESSFGEGLRGAQEVASRYMMVEALDGLAAVAGATGRPQRAARLRSAAEALARAIGYLPDPDAQAIYEPHITAARLNLDQASWDAASAEGGAMPLVKAIEYGLTEQTAPQDASLPRQ